MNRGKARLLVVLVALTSALLAGVLGTASVASAAPLPVPPALTIVSPTVGSPVSGTVTFTVSIDQPDAAHWVTDVNFQIFGATQGWKAQDVTVDEGRCAPTCTISATFDTRTLVVPTNPIQSRRFQTCPTASQSSPWRFTPRSDRPPSRIQTSRSTITALACSCRTYLSGMTAHSLRGLDSVS